MRNRIPRLASSLRFKTSRVRDDAAHCTFILIQNATHSTLDRTSRKYYRGTTAESIQRRFTDSHERVVQLIHYTGPTRVFHDGLEMESTSVALALVQSSSKSKPNNYS